MIGIALLLCLYKPGSSDRPYSRFAGLICLAFILMVAGNFVSTLLECGFTQCGDDPTRYLWLDALSGMINRKP